MKMENVSLTCKVLLDIDYLTIKKELVLLKKTIAEYTFLDRLQSLFGYINDSIVKCGCERCTDMCGGNYPDDEDNRGTGEPGYSMYWVSSEGKMNTVDDVKNCLLYKWFKEKCEQYKVPVPDDSIDHPELYPRNFNLSFCLGRGLRTAGHSESEIVKRWKYRVKNMSYADQITTLYPMLHFMNFITLEESDKESFGEWFRIKDVSII